MRGRRAQRRSAAARPADAGFTMVEVIVALALLGIIATAALGFTVRALKSSAHVQRAQTAVAVASSAMEQVRNLDPGFRTVGATQLSNLALGRTQAAVDAQWGPSGSSPLDATTSRSWDPTATAASTPTVPLTTYVTASGDVRSSASAQTYTVDRLVGACYIPHADPSGACALLPAGGAAGDYAAMVRVVVRVTWPSGGAGTCAATGCTYQLTELVDPNGDPKWRATNDRAVDDVATVVAGSTTSIAVLANDVLTPGAAPSYAATVAVVPPQGNAVAQADGTIAFTAPSSFVGTTTFRYRARNVAGVSTDPATVTVTVKPGAGSYTVTTPAQTGTSSAVALDVMSHTTGTTAASTLTITQLGVAPGVLTLDGATAAVGSSGRNAAYTPALDTVGTYTFRYTTTVNGLTSAPGTVTIKVVPVVSDQSVSVSIATAAAQAGGYLDLSTNVRPGVYQGSVQVAHFTLPSCLAFSDYPYQDRLSTGQVRYQPPTATGTCTFTYSVYASGNSGRLESNTATVTIAVGN